MVFHITHEQFLKLAKGNKSNNKDANIDNSKLIGKTPNGKDVYELNGKKYVGE